MDAHQYIPSELSQWIPMNTEGNSLLPAVPTGPELFLSSHSDTPRLPVVGETQAEALESTTSCGANPAEDERNAFHGWLDLVYFHVVLLPCFWCCIWVSSQRSRKPYDVYILPHGLSLLLQELILNTLNKNMPKGILGSKNLPFLPQLS